MSTKSGGEENSKREGGAHDQDCEKTAQTGNSGHLFD